MSPRTSSSGTDDAPAEEEAPAQDVPVIQQQMNEAMAAAAEQEAEDAAVPNYPAGAEVLNAQNVRRYPELFTDEQRATIPTDELPETDIERAQREQAEKAEAET